MTGLIALPREIHRGIFSYTDQESCKGLRLTCCLFRDIGQERLFREARVSSTIESCQRFEKLLENKHLSQFVTKLCFDIIKWDPEEEAAVQEKEGDRNEEGEKEDDEKGNISERLWRLIGCPKEFPRLQSVALCFSHDCHNGTSWLKEVAQDNKFRAAVLNKFMSSLLSLPRPPRELAIRDLQNINTTDPATVAMITKVLGGLQSLRLNIMSEHDERNGEKDLNYEEPHRFFPELPSFWLKPAAPSLQHLTLYSSLYFGFYPKLDLREVHFPQLKTLSFGNYCFVHDSQLDWILSHGATLTELYLDDCPILFEMAIGDKGRTYLSPDEFRLEPKVDSHPYTTYATRWHDYFRAFKDGLPHLRHFGYGHCPYWWKDGSTPFERETEIDIGMTDESYMVFSDGWGPSPYMEQMIYTVHGEDGTVWVDGEPLPPMEEDKKVLKELYAKIGQIVELD